MLETIDMKNVGVLIKDIKRIVRIDSLRKLFVIELIIVLILIQGIYAVRPMPKVWPFSNYPMFSYSGELDTIAYSIRLTGITPDGREITLPYSYCFLPLDRISFSNTMLYNSRNTEKQHKVMDALLRELFILYQVNRPVGVYDCPEIIGLKVYRLEWDWTDVPPESAVHKEELVYSIISGKSTHY
jgi:hypothetical protein